MASELLDLSLDDAQNSKFRNIYHSLIKQQAKDKIFSEPEAQILLLAYHKYVLKNGRRAKYMTRKQVSTIFHNLMNMMDPQIIDGLLTATNPTSKNFVSPKTFLQLMAVLLKGTLEQRIELCFKTYDTHGLGYLTKDKLRRYFRSAFQGEQEEQEEITNEFVETVFRKMDLDRDGRISFEDYAESVKKNPCLLQFMGQCIPDLKILGALLKSEDVQFKSHTSHYDI